MVYDTMKQASAGLGIPVAKLRRAKALGCDAFKSGRVDSDKLAAWLRSRPPVEGAADADAKTAAEVRRTLAAAKMAEHRLRLAKGAAIGYEQAKRVFGLCAANVKTRLRALPSKLAPLCEGLDLHARQELMAREIDDALEELSRARLREG